ncbi:MAG: hypothetical protein J0I07_22290, partial [Myxococcales bacterium]|nr:hypothetical protein [Myxococcales bacterium]
MRRYLDMKTISKRVLPIITFGAGLWLLGGCMSPTDETDPLMDEAQATDTEAQATDTEEQTETVNQALPIGAAGIGFAAPIGAAA